MKLDLFGTVVLGVLVACSVSGCSNEQPSGAGSPDSSSVTVSAGVEPVETQATQSAYLTEFSASINDPRVLNWEGVGVRDGDFLTTNATNGFLIFGPKLPFDKGSYKAELFGAGLNILPGNSIIIDVTSNSGQLVHGKQELAAGQTSGDENLVGVVDFQLDSPVSDLELRVYVTSGSSIVLERYSIRAVPSSVP